MWLLQRRGAVTAAGGAIAFVAPGLVVDLQPPS
jgi:hypothetical protein